MGLYHHMLLLLAMLVGTLRIYALDNSWSVIVTNRGAVGILTNGATLNFGALFVGNSVTNVTIVTNESQVPLTLLSVAMDNAQFAVLFTNTPAVIAPQGQLPVPIVFAPESEGVHTGELRFKTDDLFRPNQSNVVRGVAFTLAASVPRLEVSPLALTFGDAGYRQSVVRTLTLRNTGTAVLEVSDLISDNTHFQPIGGVGPFEIPPGDSRDVSITFTPDAPVTEIGLIAIICNDPVGAIRRILLSGTGRFPRLSFSVEEVDFGKVPVGESKEATFTVNNSGNAPLVVTGMRIDDKNFLGVAPTAAATLPPGGSLTVRVKFAPSAQGEHTAHLTALSNDPTETKLFVTLKGTGTVPDIELSQNTLDFGVVVFGQTKELSFIVRNLGEAPLRLTGLTTSSSVFRLVEPRELPTISQAGSATVTLAFEPCSNGDQEGVLTIRSNDPDEPELNVDLRGNAAAAEKFTVVLRGAHEGSYVVTFPDGTRQELTVNVTVHLTLNPASPKLIGEKFVSTAADVEGHVQVIADATEVFENQRTSVNFTKDTVYTKTFGVPVRMEFSPLDGSLTYFRSEIADPMLIARDDLKPYRLEYTASTGTLKVWIRLPAPFRYEEQDEFYEADAIACVSGAVGSVKGRVVECEGDKPIAGVTVKLDEASMMTDAEGRFRFDRVPIGKHNVLISKTGFAALRSQIILPGFDITLAGFQLAPLLFTAISILDETNKTEHHTSEFSIDRQKARWDSILRRGQSFQVKTEFPCPVPGGYAVRFEARDRSAGGTEVWSAKEVDAPVGNARTYRVEIPADAAVGEYDITASVYDRVSAESLVTQGVGRPIVVLFNPWAEKDDVFGLPQEALDQSLISDQIKYFTDARTQYPAIKFIDYYDSPKPQSRSWTSGHFTETCLQVVLLYLSELSPDARRSSFTVARHLVQRVNAERSFDEPDNRHGLLKGQWGPCDYEITSRTQAEWSSREGKRVDPRVWLNTTEICETFWASKSSVTYAQCWVFACVLTSLNRCLGIPSRAVTSYNVGIDKNRDGKLRLEWAVQSGLPSGKVIVGRPDGALCPDGLWNFHVWCEAWIRSEMPQPDAWKVLDGTPMQTLLDVDCGEPPLCIMAQGGLYGAGPVPHDTIRSTPPGQAWGDDATHLGYFVSEVRPDVEYVLWQNGQPQDLLPVPAVEICPEIVTYEQSAPNGQSDLTALYKGSVPSISQMSLAKKRVDVLQGIQIKFRPFDPTERSTDLIWQVELTNTTDHEQTCDVLLSGAAMEYNGINLGPLGNSLDDNVTIGSGEMVLRKLVFPAENYFRWLKRTRIFEARLLVTHSASGRSAFHHEWVVLGMPEIVFHIGSGLVLQIGKITPVQVVWTNTLPKAVSNAQMTLYGSRGVRFGTNSTLQLQVPALAPGGVFEKVVEVIVEDKGPNFLAGRLFADEVEGIYGEISLGDGGPWRLELRLSPTRQPILSFLAAEGRTYQLEFTEALVAGPWKVLGLPIRGAGRLEEVGDPAWSGQTQRYYRLRVLNE